MVKSKKFVYAKAFKGPPTSDNFRLEEEQLSALKEGEILCEAVFLSVDPYMRPFMANMPIGTIMIGGQIAKIIESKNKDFPIGKYVFGQFGWRTLTLVNPAAIENHQVMAKKNAVYLLPEFGELSVSLGLGCLGMPGNTAYFGFLEICQPKAGETVVVTTAAGAVGSLVGQIAKIKGCKVIGFAGSDEKCEWLEKGLAFDVALNYKMGDIGKKLKKAAPNGIDCYFDNVGGEISSIIISQMNQFGRISICGSIASYNDDKKDFPKATILQPSFIWSQLKMEGFIVYRWSDRYMEGINQMFKWIKEGKIKYRETLTEGFENMPKAFMEMLEGKNIGKAIVKVI